MAPSRHTTDSSSGLNRRPTMDRSLSQTGAPQSASSPVQSTFGGRVHTAPDEDRVLTMRERSEREREKERSEEKSKSQGKAGGVGVGVTRPKRRLSSLPNLIQPFIPLVPFYRAMSANSVNSPPLSPRGDVRHNPYHSLQQQSFKNQQTHATSTANSYSVYNRANPPKLDEKSGGMVGFATAMAAASREKEGPPTLWGIELKWISLITLALQNAFLTIIMHYSRITSSPGQTYSAAAAVLFNELLKGVISVVIALKRIDNEMMNATTPAVYSEKHDEKKKQITKYPLPSLFHPSRLHSLYTQVFSRDCWKLSVPAILYVIQNNLQYVAASNLDVATFQVTYQMKILTTAFFSVLFLSKRLSRAKWASLVLLAVGVGIVQIQSTAAPSLSSHTAHPSTHVKVSHSDLQLRSEIPAIPDDPIISAERMMHPVRGFMAVTMACLTSGLAGVYFEYILKSSKSSNVPSAPQPDLWIRNTQLSLFSLLPALVPIILNPPGAAGVGYFTRVMGCFANFNGWAMGTVLTQTLGGLITALVIKYSDNIMKGFATSLSIVISFLASVALFSYPITFTFVLGASIVLFATYCYNAPAANPPTRNAVAVAPGSPITTTAPILGEPEKPSRATSVINLLGLVSNAGSRKPSMTDIKSYTTSQFGRSSFTVSTSPSPTSTPVPGSQSSAYGSAYEDTSGRSSPSVGLNASPQYPIGPLGPGAGFGRGTVGDKVRPILALEVDKQDRKH